MQSKRMIVDDNQITAMLATTRDLSRLAVDHGDPLDQTLDEAKRQFLEAKDRFLEAKRRYLMLSELARLRQVLRLRKESRHSATYDLAARSRPDYEANENVLRLQKLKELIQLREIRLRRQQRAHRLRDNAEAAQRRRQDPELMDNLRKLRKLRELVQLHERILHRQTRALAQRDYTVTAQRFAAHHHAGNTLWKQLGEPEPKPAPIEKPIQRQGRGCSSKACCRTNTWRKYRNTTRNNPASWSRLRGVRRRQQNLGSTRRRCSKFRQRHQPVGLRVIPNSVVRGPPQEKEKSHNL